MEEMKKKFDALFTRDVNAERITDDKGKNMTFKRPNGDNLNSKVPMQLQMEGKQGRKSVMHRFK